MTGGATVVKYIEKVVKRGGTLYVKVPPKMAKEEDVKTDDYVVIDIKKVKL